MPKYIDVAKQLVRLYRLNLDCGDVIREFLVTAEPEEVVEKERYDSLLENSIIISDALSKYQSADMVAVVRCKDCKRRKQYECDNIMLGGTKCGVTDDWYCADGERKGGGGEE